MANHKTYKSSFIVFTFLNWCSIKTFINFIVPFTKYGFHVQLVLLLTLEFSF